MFSWTYVDPTVLLFGQYPIFLHGQQVPKYCSHVENGYMIPKMSYYSTMPDNVG